MKRPLEEAPNTDRLIHGSPQTVHSYQQKAKSAHHSVYVQAYLHELESDGYQGQRFLVDLQKIVAM